jgi:hypothetical protein
VHYTYPSVDQRWRMEQKKWGILPWNPQQHHYFTEGMLKSMY